MSKKLDARDFHFEEWNRTSRDGAFDFLKQKQLPVSVGDEEFDEETFDQMDFWKHGACFSIYGSGHPYEHAAVRLDNGNVMFCIVYGTVFNGTFDSNEKIHMQYYMATPLTPT